MSRSHRQVHGVMAALGGVVLAAVIGTTGVGAGFTTPAGGAAPAGLAVDEVEEVLSHFLCYGGDFKAYDEKPFIGLEDQFGAVEAQVLRARLWCNPVRKRRGVDDITPIVSRDHHLKAYRIATNVIPKTFGVLDTNQFGVDQQITLESAPVRLLVPTRKLPHDAPRLLDHFACYKVTEADAVNKRVRLRDQFGAYQTVVRTPLLHCNPTYKNHDGKEFFVEYKYAHLLCYGIDRRQLDPPAYRKTANQFERAWVRARSANMLCVPSLKKEL